MIALCKLLGGSIDYAGLFPPAELDMSAAVDHYARYRDSDDRWALGRFVVGAARLAEFEAAAARLPSNPEAEPWRLAALLGTDPAADLRVVDEFNCRHAAGGAPGVVADVVETKAASVNAVTSLLEAVPAYLQAYIEVPADADPAPLVAAMGGRRGRAKIRTGGVTAGAFPPTAAVVRFMSACIEAGVPFKATAGLHHPLRAEFPLTYAPDSPRGTMFGFLNVFLAAAFMADGLDATSAARLLEETNPGSLLVTADAIEWRGHHLDLAAIEAARRRTIVSFGSCSFTEPIGDLAALGLL